MPDRPMTDDDPEDAYDASDPAGRRLIVVVLALVSIGHEVDDALAAGTIHEVRARLLVRLAFVRAALFRLIGDGDVTPAVYGPFYDDLDDLDAVVAP